MRYRIGLDTRMILHSGIGTYLRGLLHGFDRIGLGPDQGLMFFGNPQPEQISGISENQRHSFDRGQGLFAAPIYSVQEQLQYPELLKRCELWHAPHYNVPLFKGTTKLVVTIHDVIHWIFRKQLESPIKEFYAGVMMRRAVALADRIIAVSQNTKQDLVDHFHADPKKVTVIYEAAGAEYWEVPAAELAVRFAEIRKKYGLPDDFFLFVGLIKPHKNILRLVRVFQKLKNAGKLRSCLVIAGRKDRKYPKDLEALNTLCSTSDIIHVPNVSFEDLPVLYNQALALVHPSFYEGFGLTVLEAMKCGTPVISSRAASLPEVTGDAAILFDPSSEAELENALQKVESDAAMREDLRLRGLARAAEFDWKKTAEQTRMVYESVLPKNAAGNEEH